MNEDVSEDLRVKITTKVEAAKDRLKSIVKEIKQIEFDYYPLPEVSKPRRIAALDGGGYSQDFVGITIIPSRAAGAVFEKEKDPIWVEINDVEILTIEDDAQNFASLFRDLLEVQVAHELLKHNPEILFLDGSITNLAYKGIPQSIRFSFEEEKKIEEDAIGFKFYELFFNFIREAYNLIIKCIERDVLLVGVSKDSRASIIVKNILAKQKKKYLISDTSFINIVTNRQAGFSKPQKFAPKKSDVREKIWKAAQVFQEKDLRSYYLTYFTLKEGVLPIRVDTLIPQQDRLKEVQEAMVTYHDGNGFITPAFLTHSRAHMRQDLGSRLVGYVAEEIFDDSPEIYNSFFSPRRRDIIQ
ncbi:MAG: DNA double-strand break repair nuclease NurA [Candidatus Heimdallarchaeota archaeon]